MPSASQLRPIYVAERVLCKMAMGALRYQNTETGEALIGFELPNGKPPGKIYVLETIAPFEDAVREWGMFEQGDDWHYAVFRWFHENWEMYRALRRASYGNAVAGKWDTPLKNLGDWHKQPGMIRPSLGDLRTAKQFIREEKLNYMLTPIVTFSDEVVEPDAQNTVLVSLETESFAVRIDFWMIFRNAGRFEAVQPILVEDEALPKLPPITWHIANPSRLDNELDLLQQAGLQVLDISLWDTRQHPPMDTCLVLHRQGTRYVVIAITPFNYPQRPPSWRVAPIVRPADDEDFFEAVFDASSPVERVLSDWHQRMTLLDGVLAIEERQQS